MHRDQSERTFYTFTENTYLFSGKHILFMLFFSLSLLILRTTDVRSDFARRGSDKAKLKTERHCRPVAVSDCAHRGEKRNGLVRLDYYFFFFLKAPRVSCRVRHFNAFMLTAATANCLIFTRRLGHHLQPCLQRTAEGQTFTLKQTCRSAG